MPYNRDQYKTDRRPIREYDLVSEQPGSFVLFLGLFFSIIVGLSIRTAAGSDWFHSRLSEAINNIGKDWQIEHGPVGLYFKNGITPAIGVYIENVKIISESKCFMKSGGFAQKIKIPLSLINYLVSGQLVSEIEVEGFKIEVSEKAFECNTAELASAPSRELEKRKKNQISIVDRVERPELRNEIQRVHIDKLEVYFPNSKYSGKLDYFVLSNTVITNKSSHPKILFLESSLDLNSFLKTSEAQAVGSLKIEYNEFPEKIIKSNLLGSLREGFFSIQLVNRLDDEKFQFQSELKNVSLLLLKGIIDDIPKGLNLKSNWLSLKLYSEGSSRDIGHSTVQIKDVLINGDLGEVSAGDIRFPMGLAEGPSPFELLISEINVSKIAVLIPDFVVPKQIENLGTLGGKIKIESKTSASLEAQLNGLQLVFSANGIRKNEKINLDKIAGEWKKNKLNIESHALYSDNNKWDGYLKFKSNDMKVFSLESQLKSVQLSQSVSELMTASSAALIFDELSIRVNGNKEQMNYRASGKVKSFSHKYLLATNLDFWIIGSTDKVQELDIKADHMQYTESMQKLFEQYSIVLPVLDSKPRLKLYQNNDSWHLKFDSMGNVRLNAIMAVGEIINGDLKTKEYEWKIYGTRNDIKINKK